MKDCQRVSYVAGNNATRSVLHTALERENALVKELSCRPEDFEESISRLLREKRVAAKSLKDAKIELATLLGERSLADAKEHQQNWIYQHRDECDAVFFNSFASCFDGSGVLVCMTGGASAKQDEGIFFLCGPDQVVNIYGKKVAALVEGKGGGKKGRFQGKLKKLSNRGGIGAILAEFKGKPN